MTDEPDMAGEIGTWEIGPQKSKCQSCGDPITEKAQFLGLSNGDFGWFCNLTCLIDEATHERAMFTDEVGPNGSPGGSKTASHPGGSA